MGNKICYLYEVLEYRAKTMGDDLYIITSNKTITYSEMWKYSLAIAKRIMRDAGREPITLNCKDNINSIITFWASTINGNDLYIIHTENNHFIIDDTYINESIANEENIQNFQISTRRDFSIYINSSGTTNRPHLIENTEEQFVESLNSIKRYKPMDYINNRTDVYISTGISHSYGLSAVVEHTLSGCRLYIPDDFNILCQFKFLYKFKTQIKAIIATPFLVKTIFQLLPQFDLKNLKYIVVGTDMIPFHLVKQILDKNPEIIVYCRYGLSELPSIISVLPISKENLDIISPQLISTHLDIYKLKHESKETFNELLIIDKHNNIIRTGDNVSINNGEYILQGRCSNIFKYHGYKINPHLIEKQLLAIKCISECVLFSENDKLILKVKLNKDISSVDILNFWKLNISIEYLPDQIIFVEEIIKTVTGKTIRHMYP